MPIFAEGEEVFFDSNDRLPFEDVKEELDYDIWIKEPKSVQERRDRFLSQMEFLKASPLHELGMDRIVQCSDAVVSSSISCNDLFEETSLDELDHDGYCEIERENTGNSPIIENFNCVENVEEIKFMKKQSKSWWRRLLKKHSGRASVHKTLTMNITKVRQNNKRCSELSAVYIEQEIHAHKGLIWTMKFSPDGQFLASGGEDGVVRIWRVTSVDASSSKCFFGGSNQETKMKFGRKKSNGAAVVIPNKIFQIEESPVHEFLGHSSDVLDLAWSKSNCLLSSSKDKTVRLWNVGCDECLHVFHHNNFVTCVQFNPVDDDHFISGSIDGKVRIWNISEGRVVDWSDLHDLVTAICYHPDGKRFVVGSLAGTCCFYESSGNHLQLSGRIMTLGRKKNSGNRITGIQFSQEEPHKVMITSEDSKVRILDGTDIVHKFKGLRNSGSQMSASFTSTGKHIISIGDDSRVYVWNYDKFLLSSSKQAKSIRSCEHFFFEGVSVAVPWSGMETKQHKQNDLPCLLQNQQSDRFSLGGWFSMDGACRGTATWPEEKLPLSDLPVEEQGDHYYDRENRHHLNDSWGLVIVTASCDGTIRTFHNYGMPVRI